MTNPLRFEPGVFYTLQGTRYLILTHHTDDALLAEAIETGQQVLPSIQDVWKHWEEGALQFILSGDCFQDDAPISEDHKRQFIYEHRTVIHSHEQRQKPLSKASEAELTEEQCPPCKPSFRGVVERLFIFLNDKQ